MRVLIAGLCVAWLAAAAGAEELIAKPATATRVLRDKLASGGEGPELVVIPAGEFVMGGGDGDSWLPEAEKPRHKVTIRRSFAIGRFEVTRGEFRRYAIAEKIQPARQCHIPGDIWGPQFGWDSTS